MIVRSGFGEASLDFAIFDNGRGSLRGRDKIPVLVSMFDRSYSNMKALVANTMWRGEIKLGSPESLRTYTDRESPVYQGYFNPINMGYERFTHAVLLRSSFNNNYLLCGPDEEMLYKVFYDYLMRMFDLPILRSWMEYIFGAAIGSRTLVECTEVYADPQGGTKSLSLYGQDIPLRSLRLYRCEITVKWLESVVTKGLENEKIQISREKQTPLFFADMDSYFNNYGNTIVDNLRRVVKPLVPLKGRVDELALNGKRLFPQQAAVVNGLVALMKKSNYAILNQGMGAGKTLQGATTIEAYFVKRYLDTHPGVTLKDVYSSEGLINYRVIIMCPGHLVEKWTNEIRTEIPYAKTEILNDFKQLVNIRERGIERQGREFYIIGKDFCKLSYSFIPVPYQVKKKRPIKIVCKNCQEAPENESDYRLKRPCSNCGGELIKVKNGSSRKGLVCPECGELIMKDKDGSETAGPVFFASKSDANEKCRYCGSSFWTSHVMNLDSESSIKTKERHWYKVSHWTNMAKKSRTTSWVLRGYEGKLLEAKGLKPDEIEAGKEILTRKVAPAGYIKKHLKGYFDFSVFDEVHLCESC